MRFRQQRAQEPEVNLTPLIDVVFLLLIFFMVSTTFEEESEFEVVLPEASQEAENDDRDSLVVSIDAAGRYEIGGVVIESGRRLLLRRTLVDAVEGRRDEPVVIRADGRTPHQSVVTLMDVAASLGLNRIAIVTATTAETVAD